MSTNYPPLGHPLLEAVATSYSQGQGHVTRNLGQAREYLDAIPDGWAKIDSVWIQFDEVIYDGNKIARPHGGLL